VQPTGWTALTFSRGTLLERAVERKMCWRGLKDMQLLAVPLPFLALDLLQGSADWFAPSGAIALFCVAFVQFRQLSRLQVKHFRNAEAAANGDTIQGRSTVYQAVDRQAFPARAG
jgi:hypothetical protein